MKKMFVLDTNVLLHSAQSLLSFHDNDVVIPMAVVEELDKFKRNQDELGRNARMTIRRLDRLRQAGNLREGVSLSRIMPTVTGNLLVRSASAGAEAVDQKIRQVFETDLSEHSPDNRILRTAANLAAESTVADEMAMAASPAPTASFSQGGGGGTGAGSSRRPGLRGVGMKKLATPARPSLALDADFGAAVADSEGAEAPQPTESKPRETVKTIGGKTFYFKDGRWIDSALDKESQTSLTPIVVEQFGDEYFELVGRLGREFSQYLAFDEPSTFLFAGRLYQIQPSKTSE